MKVTQMPPVHAAHLVANSGNTAYGVDVIAIAVKLQVYIAPNPKTYIFVASSCSCLCPIHWSKMLSGEWRCSWSSAGRRWSKYIWVINNFIAYYGATYIRDLKVTYYPFENGVWLARGSFILNSPGLSVFFILKVMHCIILIIFITHILC